MANQNDSFIDEVTEDLRRDRLFAMFRRYGWLALLLILAIVGGAAWREYSATKARQQAQAWGDAVLAAQKADDPAAALAAVDGQGSAARKALSEMLAAGAEVEAGQGAQAAQRLKAAAALVADDPVLHDLALLKAVMAAGSSMDPAERDATLTQLSKPGAPFELLALEQKVVALIDAGRNEDAITLIGQIQQKDGLSEPLRRRLSEMMITLGAEPQRDQDPGPQTMPAPAVN
ncbi:MULTISPECIES: tetratricopeptide repeat protein [unclassified Paracoccus (in: a-proteobacteria)]|uniref:tetratricopeptide repeat protein n=1 Tax=unclassified Paracoccus (in: a-proteobacteria) TaxID=2688777 RepID=UPI0012B33539|nr:MULTISPECIES: tetratricopeptide repeat protein [unclassified Paracoccus (in: a-proteobacteria)]UXU75329.1 tetratricopeptide repeat protein [Paracoccus sp. SMMA_5]UXU81232.1 tetratricopeptide repeat protein [Paracoccus sp. SMMA_5_TC]